MSIRDHSSGAGLTRPCLAFPAFVEGTNVLIDGDDFEYVIAIEGSDQSELIALLASLDGSHTVDEVISILGKPDLVCQALDELNRYSLLYDAAQQDS